MYTLLVLYGRPADPGEFRNYYESVHVPIARKIPDVLASRYSLNVTAAEGTSQFAAMFEADFESSDKLFAALASPEGQAAQADVANFATGGVQIFHFEPVTAHPASPAYTQDGGQQ